MEPDYDSDSSNTIDSSQPDEEQSELDAQLRRESTAELPTGEPQAEDPQTHPWRLPPNLDLEWMAFEVYTEEPPTDSDVEESELDVQIPSSTITTPQRAESESPGLASHFSKLDLRPSTPTSMTSPRPNTQLIPSPQKSSNLFPQRPQASTATPAIKTSLSLLEMLVRLTALQQFQQTSHLAIPDELLTFFLSDSSTVGSGGDSELRRRVRREARMRVGFDPYDESPIKRRGEEYLEHEFQDGEGRFDYEGYPHGKASTISSRSRSATPIQSPSMPGSSPIGGGRAKSSADIPLPSREIHSSISSASPLLRRATTQPGQYRAMKQPSFRGPPTAPPTSSSPRITQAATAAKQMGMGSQPPDTPPSSAIKHL
ncbi:Ran-specific GTPase-activating protein 30 [Kalmusia sp. IMI 367209]|nr:Ran-specific GTPase-activating protein 30 [Kalmusia sp. IMI 367209]